MKEKAVVAIDLGGTNIKIGLVKGEKILLTDHLDSNSELGLRPRLTAIESRINALIDKASLSVWDIRGIGIAVPGIVDHINRRVLSINAKYRDVTDINLSAWAKETFGLPLFLENDSRAALLGEWKFGKGRGCDNLVLMTLGTGIGTAAVIEGKLLRGKHFQAGILGGHFIINTDGNICNCGTKGCAEAEASTWNLHQIVTANPGYSKSLLKEQEILDFKTVFSSAENGDSLAVSVRNQCMDIWASCAFNLVQAYDPEALILAGGLMGSGELIIPVIQDKLDRNSWATWGKVKVLEASLIHTAALLGVGSLVQNQIA